MCKHVYVRYGCICQSTHWRDGKEVGGLDNEAFEKNIILSLYLSDMLEYSNVS